MEGHSRLANAAARSFFAVAKVCCRCKWYLPSKTRTSYLQASKKCCKIAVKHAYLTRTSETRSRARANSSENIVQCLLGHLQEFWMPTKCIHVDAKAKCLCVPTRCIPRLPLWRSHRRQWAMRRPWQDPCCGPRSNETAQQRAHWVACSFCVAKGLCIPLATLKYTVEHTAAVDQCEPPQRPKDVAHDTQTALRSTSPSPTAHRESSSLGVAAWRPPQSLEGHRFSPHPPNDLQCWHSLPNTNLAQKRRRTRRREANVKYHSRTSQHLWDEDPARSTTADRDTTFPSAPQCLAWRGDVLATVATTAPAMPSSGPSRHRNRSWSCDHRQSVVGGNEKAWAHTHVRNCISTVIMPTWSQPCQRHCSCSFLSKYK